MPTYEFRCPLGHEFERFYRTINTAEAQTACPECGKMAERIMSVGAGLHFKGSGFYLTDYGPLLALVLQCIPFQSLHRFARSFA